MATGWRICQSAGKSLCIVTKNRGRLRIFRYYGTQRRSLPENRGYVPTLSPPQVTSLLTLNEASVETKAAGQDSVSAFESNCLASNHPIEDRRAISRLLQTKGTLFGVFDGHGGAACAQAISERLFEYIAVSLLDQELLESFNHALRTDSTMELLHKYEFRNDYSSGEMSSMYRSSLQRYVVETLSFSGVEEDLMVDDAIRAAFLRVDNDITTESMPLGGMINRDSLEVALSGSCACAAHISGLDVKVANIGDARAVIGRMDEDGKSWTCVPMSSDHNAENKEEAERVARMHPASESKLVLKNNRLLGQLIPLRAFGDVRYKWSLNDLQKLVKAMDSVYAQSIIPLNYYTPPYLSSEPEIMSHRLTQNDRFMVLASDGLWEVMPSEKVVKLIGEHLEGRQIQDKFVPPTVGKLGGINKELQRRQKGLAHKAVDMNSATHLIRQALGRDHRKVSEMLTFPPDISRHYRDDITVIVVYFDTGFLEQNA